MSVSSSTYRLQCNGGLGFARMRELVPYLAKLGISDVYLSPIFAARSGSLHGYDVVDPARLNPELGTEDEFAAMTAELGQRDMGLLLDIVPNHMSASHENPWWVDVLKHGRDSQYAAFFDIDWSGDGKIVLPLLGRPLPEVLDGSELRIETLAGESWLIYHDHRFPLRDGSEAADIERALSGQHYELAYWRDDAARLNYRRFFDVESLAGLRQEDQDVFESTHPLIQRLLRDGAVSGLRIDHIDGLHDPARYLDRLAAIAPETTLLVEKILAADEAPPDEWPVDGTTGYEYLNAANGLFVDPDGLAQLKDTYAQFAGRSQSFAGRSHVFGDVVFDAKRQVARELFPAELSRLTRDLAALVPDAAGAALADTIVSVAAAFPVYRTYVNGFEVRPRDRAVIEQALSDARSRAGGDAIDALGRVLLLDVPEAQRTAALDFVMRWQQFTGPLAAKGLEDTALYRYNALLSMNEVGAAPDGPAATSQKAFHEFNKRRLERSPRALNATSTHDTKRGEDVRARLNVLSELPGEWAQHQQRWSELAGATTSLTDGEPAPSPNDETLIYQTLVGAWPLGEAELPQFRERMRAYVIKAAREAKVRTSWLDPNAEYEAALIAFVDALFDSQLFLDDFQPFQQRIAEHAVTNSLAQVLLKIASPGVPDVYQGTELWDLSLVDPDNRRPVDFTARARMLDEIADAGPSARIAGDLLSNWQDGRIKLYVTHLVLSFRRANDALFASGDYLPLDVTGAHAHRVFAFARRYEDTWAIAVIPRLVAGLGFPPVGDVWRDTAVVLPTDAPDPWSNVLTGEPLAASEGVMLLEDAFEVLPLSYLTGSKT